MLVPIYQTTQRHFLISSQPREPQISLGYIRV